MRVAVYEALEDEGFHVVPLGIGERKAVAVVHEKVDCKKVAEEVGSLLYMTREVEELKLCELGKTFSNNKGIGILVFDPERGKPIYAYGRDMVLGRYFGVLSEDLIIYDEKEGGLGLTIFSPESKKLYTKMVSVAKKAMQREELWYESNLRAEFTIHKRVVAKASRQF